jgi:uncharacterized protein YifN (PemK superfamily)
LIKELKLIYIELCIGLQITGGIMSQYTNFTETSKKDLDTLHKVLRTANLNMNNSCYHDRTGVYYPILERGHIVRCEFVGIGSEIDDTHYAIVWEAQKSREAITVIPITSAPKDEDVSEFYLGKIDGFITSQIDLTVKDTYVYLSKIKEVSRKRIKEWAKRDVSNGNIIRDSKGNAIIAQINNNQKRRIQDAIKIAYLDAEYLVRILLNYKKSLLLPVANYDSLLLYGYRCTKTHMFTEIDATYYKLQYEMDDESTGSIDFYAVKYDSSVQALCNKIEYHNNKITFRENLIKALFSNNQDKIVEAKAIISRMECLAKNNP